MNNLTSAFSLYEVLRILLPGFYTTIMLKQIVISAFPLKFEYPDSPDGLLIFIVLSVVVGGLLYSIDVPRWFKSLYETLPSNLIEKSKLLDKPAHGDQRYFQNEYFKFYYELNADTKFKTEIQSGFFHLFMTMAFVNIGFTIAYSLICTNSGLIWEYRMLNALLSVVNILAAFIMYKQKLKYSWKRNFELFRVSLEKKANAQVVAA